MFSGTHGGSSTISGGSAGTRSHDHSPNSASHRCVNTRARSIPPCSRTNSAAAAHVLAPRARRRRGAAPSRPRSSSTGRPGRRGSSPTCRRRAAASGSTRPSARSPSRRRTPEELAQQHVLGVHRHVRLQLPLPPAGRVLQGEQVLARALQRHLCLAARPLRSSCGHAGKLDLFRRDDDACAPCARAPASAWHRRWRHEHLGVRERDHVAAQRRLATRPSATGETKRYTISPSMSRRASR